MRDSVNPGTKFAPAERASMEKVMEQKRSIESSEFLDKVLAETPFMFFILNEHRQVIYSNHLLMKHLGYNDMNDLAGFRPGELFSCIHSEVEPGGCGTAESCRYCGAIQAILESKKQGGLVIRDCSLNLNIGEKVVAANYQVSSRPFSWKGEEFFIATLEDISSVKRKEQLERTFFHDIKNKAGTVLGFLNLLKKEREGNTDQFYDMAVRGVSELLEDIEYQRYLVKAEAGDLEVHKDHVSVRDLLNNVCADYHEMGSRGGIQVETLFNHEEVFLFTDPVLLKRVLGNMVKNAVEASEKDDKVTITYEIDQDSINLIVQNPAVMTEEIRLQIFYKSFSTKGAGRGIGTYSIKLFTEEYLDGKVSFTSKEQTGTEFRVTLPLNGKDTLPE